MVCALILLVTTGNSVLLFESCYLESKENQSEEHTGLESLVSENSVLEVILTQLAFF